MQNLNRPVPKNQIIEGFDLTVEMKERMTEYLFSLHGMKENTKDNYLSRLKMLGEFLAKHRIMMFEDADSRDIDLFLSRYDNENTLNAYIHVFRSFYNFIKRPEVVSHLKLCTIELEQITPSEILTPEEVVAISQESGKRREMYKPLILALYESCARISEVLNLKLGDVVFSSVTDKEGHRKLIATLHFKRSKGGVKKQPVVLVMFASELKRWVDSHPYRSDKQACARAAVMFIILGLIFFMVFLWIVKTGASLLDLEGLEANWAVFAAAILSSATVLGAAIESR